MQSELCCQCGCGGVILSKKCHKYYTPKYIQGHKSAITKERFKQTCLKKYGVDSPAKSIIIKKRMKQACLKKYGVGHPSQSIKIKVKFKQTCLKKYGVGHPLQNKKIKDKQKQTCREKYGVDNVSQHKEIKLYVKKKRLKITYDRLFFSDRLKGLVKPLFSLEDYRGIHTLEEKDNKYKFQCLQCNNTFEDNLADGRIPRCYTCFPVLKTYTSKCEDVIENWLRSFGIKDIQRGNMSIINPYQLDIYLPGHKLAIEFNGLYWHSEIGGGKDKNYHLNKTNLCKEKGIQLMHIFEDEWINKQEIVKSIIKNKLGLIDYRIYARECAIKEVDKEEALLFLMNNHLQEPLKTKYNYGVYYKDDLVHLISLSKPRFNKNYEYEVVRSCSKIDTVVIGGFSKMLKYVEKELNIQSLISYVDKRYFNGTGYKDWALIGETKPNYFYMKDYQNREGRLKYQKHKIMGKEEDRSLTEWQIMQLKGYDRIWDCGNKVFCR